MKPVLRVTHLNLMALAAILDCFFIVNIFWLVVLTPLKNFSQREGLSHILWNIKNVWNHQECGFIIPKHFNQRWFCVGVWKSVIPSHIVDDPLESTNKKNAPPEPSSWSRPFPPATTGEMLKTGETTCSSHIFSSYDLWLEYVYLKWVWHSMGMGQYL